MKNIVLILSLCFSLGACQANNESGDNPKNWNMIELVQNNDLEKVKQALEQGQDVNQVNKHAESLLLLATQNKSKQMAELLVSFSADVNQQAKNLDSPFLLAGATGQTSLVELYLKNGADFQVFNRYNGTALIPACEKGHLQTVIVLANTPDFPINHVNRLGWTAVMEAVILGDGTKVYQDILKVLKKAGANMHIADSKGITPLQHAKRLGFTQIVQILES
ncbi:ankyrin repeat domain-containing protein [Myroides sp. LJL119]